MVNPLLALTCAWRIIKSAEWRDFEVLIRLPGMRDFLILFVHLIVTVVRLAGPGGLRSVVAESALVRYQLLILNRGRKRAPNLRPTDRIIAGLCTLFMRRARTLRSAIVLKASTLLHLHAVLCKRKYRTLFSPQRRHRPGPKGPKKDLIDAVVATKRRNRQMGLPPHCSADRVGVRHRDRQGCGSPNPERSLPAATRISRSFLAYVSRPHEG